MHECENHLHDPEDQPEHGADDEECQHGDDKSNNGHSTVGGVHSLLGLHTCEGENRERDRERCMERQ